MLAHTWLQSRGLWRTDLSRILKESWEQMREATLICMAHTARNRCSQSQGFSALSEQQQGGEGWARPQSFWCRGLGSGLSTCISDWLPGMLGLLVWGPHFENHCVAGTAQGDQNCFPSESILPPLPGMGHFLTPIKHKE